MQAITLVIDYLLDAEDYSRLAATTQPYLYNEKSSQLYLKHLRHLDYHHPNLVLSYDKTHLILNTERRQKQPFYLDNEGLTKPYSVALGVTDQVAMIALGDTQQTKLQVVDVDQPLRVFINTTYHKDTEQLFPVPKLFRGNSLESELIYADGSTLSINLQTFEVGRRRLASGFTHLPRVLSPYLSILGPFILLHITPQMGRGELYFLRSLVELASDSRWIAVDSHTVVDTQTVAVSDFDDLIEQRRKELSRVRQLLSSY